MHFVLFYHSLIADWNHGNAHFIRGVVRELLRRNHRVTVYEEEGNWSLTNMLREGGSESVLGFRRNFPRHYTNFYDPDTIDLPKVLDDADVVLVHEWNEPELVRAIGQVRKKRDFTLLFHDTHHRSISDPHNMSRFDLEHYDGVLAFGDVIRMIYEQRQWCRRAWTWHEAADIELFRPLPAHGPRSDLVWIGNWGDDERTAELHQYLFDPVHELELDCSIYGVRYPSQAQEMLRQRHITYRGWLPNYQVPTVFAHHTMTVHVPRRWYTDMLPGIPTIRVFEALACGIPLISAPWQDSENLFRNDEDFLMAQNPRQMREYMQLLRSDQSLARKLSSKGLERIHSHHTCGHRVNELLAIVDSCRPADAHRASQPAAAP